MLGIAVAGRFYRHSNGIFWNIHEDERALTIDLNHDGYVSLVVEVEDPSKTVELMRQAIAPGT